MLASTRSVVGNAEEFCNGIMSPVFNSSGDGSGGAVQLHVLGAQQAGLADLGQRVDGQLDVRLQVKRQRRDPVLQLDRPHAADVDVGDPDPAIDVERQRVRHLHVDGHACPGRCRDRPATARWRCPATTHTSSAPAQPRPMRRCDGRSALQRLITALLLQRAAAVPVVQPAPVPGAGPDNACDPPGSPGITPGAGPGGGPGCGYHGGGSGLFSS